jgi:hypothetical protein
MPYYAPSTTAATASAGAADTSVATTAFVQNEMSRIPQGRLTLVSATPVLISNQTAKTSIFYSPFKGDKAPIYDGTNWAMKTFAELTLSLDTSNHLLENLYDVFIWNNSGTISIGTGPAWVNTATVTWTSASPGVCTWTAHGLAEGSPVIFTAGTATPTGITAGTTYYVSKTGLAANSFSVSTTIANAAAGTNVNTSSTGTGTQTGTNHTTVRGSGAGTTELERKNGILANKNSITLKNGAGAGTSGIAVDTATYVGTFYCTANGQTGMNFKPTAAGGGTNSILGLFNAHNRVPLMGVSRDSTASWTDTSASTQVKVLNASVSNRVCWVDGLAEVIATANNINTVQTSAGTLQAVIATNMNNTTATPGVAQGSAANGIALASTVRETYLPALGFNYAQAMQTSTSAGTSTFYGAVNSHQQQSLTIELEL